MNEYFYENLIRIFIRNKDRKILQKKDTYLITFHYSQNKKNNLLHIFLHLGYPCIKRYCTCFFFTNEDILFSKKSIFNIYD